MINKYKFHAFTDGLGSFRSVNESGWGCRIYFLYIYYRRQTIRGGGGEYFPSETNVPLDRCRLFLKLEAKVFESDSF